MNAASDNSSAGAKRVGDKAPRSVELAMYWFLGLLIYFLLGFAAWLTPLLQPPLVYKAGRLIFWPVIALMDMLLN